MTSPTPSNSSSDLARDSSRRRQIVILVAVILAVFVACGWLKSRLAVTSVDLPRPDKVARIISLAPSVTETLFALGLGDRVVGVSRFCEYPPEIDDRPRVGGLFDPNIEAIVALRPDLVVLTDSAEGSRAAFEKLGMTTLVVDHRDPEGIFTSFSTIGRAAGVERAADELTARLRTRLARVTEATAGLARPRVMIAVDHGGSRIENVYAAGANPSFNLMLQWAGGENVFGGVPEAFPVVSREAMLHANPEVIVDLINVGRLPSGGVEACHEAWREIKQLDAVANGRVYVVTESYATVPGPRFILLVERLARLLHPEVDWDEAHH